jgi:hypothetical protein
MRPVTRSVIGLLWFLIAGGAKAQFAQYTAPGGPQGRPVDRKGALEKETESARLRLGPLRVAPTIALKDVAYIKNLLGQGSTAPTDFTATLSGGARAYLRTGQRVYWTGYALPEYVYWQKETARRRLDGLYGAGVDGFWNRLTLRVAAGSDAAQQIITAEVPRPTHVRIAHFTTTAELRLTGAISSFVSGNYDQQRTLVNAKDPLTEILAGLDRDDRVVRAGLRWRPGGGWVVGLAGERSDATFTDRGAGAIDRSNSGTAPVLELTRDHGRLFLHADVAQRALTGKQGAMFRKYDKTTGSVAVSYEITRNVEATAYANRNLVYSLLPDYFYFDDLRHGASLNVKLSERASVRVFGETGSLDYTAILPTVPRRRDDLTSFGGAVSLQVVRHAVVSLVGSSTRFNSNLPGANRSLDTLGITVTLAAGLPQSVVSP